MSKRAAERVREIFSAALEALDVRNLVRRRLAVDAGVLRVGQREIPLAPYDEVLVVTIGKAAAPMAAALAEQLQPVRATHAVGGIVVTHEPVTDCAAHGLEGFEVLRGSHPVPDTASLAAGEAVLRRVARADRPETLILFGLSGGTSALCESPRHPKIDVTALQEAGRVLVGCGARIDEINAVRRTLSAIKGGRLSAAAPRAAQVSLLLSDVDPDGDLADLGSGPTLAPRRSAADEGAFVADVLERYELVPSLPAAVVTCVQAAPVELDARDTSRDHVEVLADNRTAIAQVARSAEVDHGLQVFRIGMDEAPVADVAAEYVKALSARPDRRRGICFVGGGEAVCPVRGDGRGGRNQETALRVAIGLDAAAATLHETAADLAFLAAGTDGQDGNSPATGAWVDASTVARGRELGLDAADHLARSDSFAFFDALGTTLVTGPTGNNLRDLRIGVLQAGGVDGPGRA